MALHPLLVFTGRHALVALVATGGGMSTDPVKPISAAVLRSLRRANLNASQRHDLWILWKAIETCECPQWAVGDHDEITAALERIARAVQTDDTTT